MMAKEQIFEVWAPPGGRWSRWVKPVLFACIEPSIEDIFVPFPQTFDLTVVPPISENVALVFDLPGSDGVWAGLSAAQLGYRPVPLYNAVPRPTPTLLAPVPPRAASLVNVEPIIVSLIRGVETLASLNVEPDAPPAFLLDWNRRGEGAVPRPGLFDNRSVSFTTDFPSATFLRSHGINRVIVVQSKGLQPQADLAHTLRRWQEEKIAIELKTLDQPGQAMPIQVPKPSAFKLVWQRVLATLGLRRHGLGGFGGIVPQPSSG